MDNTVDDDKTLRTIDLLKYTRDIRQNDLDSNEYVIESPIMVDSQDISHCVVGQALLSAKHESKHGER